MLHRCHVFNGMSFLVAKVYYQFSKMKTNLNISMSVVRHINCHRTALFKERLKQTHQWPQVHHTQVFHMH